jgi:hypothetical protein
MVPSIIPDHVLQTYGRTLCVVAQMQPPDATIGGHR